MQKTRDKSRVSRKRNHSHSRFKIQKQKSITISTASTAFEKKNGHYLLPFVQIWCQSQIPNLTSAPSQVNLLLTKLLQLSSNHQRQQDEQPSNFTSSSSSSPYPSSSSNGYRWSRLRLHQKQRTYWSSRREAWPRMIPEGSTVSKVFGSRAYERYRYDLTLLEATERNDDGDNVFARLVKESTAALINSYTRKAYPYSAWEVKTAVIQGLVSGEAAAVQARRFYDANRACN
ncbi:hypothetical protein OSB04_000927 [Centaurea solstitialis]|uniref:Uncharacterized protein n=1 Tax=Centaurea solstitialis TaxID=347529 RepID=A0AA38U2Q9_9ASTR|nr:hypothetical protein OSB04_000927 [Centaurea solstitialis]